MEPKRSSLCNVGEFVYFDENYYKILQIRVSRRLQTRSRQSLIFVMKNIVTQENVDRRIDYGAFVMLFNPQYEEHEIVLYDDEHQIVVLLDNTNDTYDVTIDITKYDNDQINMLNKTKNESDNTYIIVAKTMIIPSSYLTPSRYHIVKIYTVNE